MFCWDKLLTICYSSVKLHTLCYNMLRHTSHILEVYLKHTSSVMQPIELKKRKKKYTSTLCCFNKRCTFEVYFVKLNQHNVNLKYNSSIL